MADPMKVAMQVTDGLSKGDPLVTGIVIALVVGLITLLFLLIRGGSKNSRQGVLFLGVCDSGKTLIYSQLVNKSFAQTYTSIKANSGEYAIPEKNKKLRVIDLPGHERLRGKLLDEYKSLARAIVFVIDSGALQKEIKEVGEYLYTILSDKSVSGHAPPVLILCNKQDLTLSKGAKVIRSQLEKEINTLRITRAAALQGVGETSTNNTFLGKSGKEFEFTDIKSLKVEFAECSALGKEKSGEKPELEELFKWLQKVA